MIQSGQGLGWAGATEEEEEGGEESRVDPWSGVTDSPASW